MQAGAATGPQRCAPLAATYEDEEEDEEEDDFYDDTDSSDE